MNTQLPTTQTSFSPFRPGLKFESNEPIADPPEGGGGTAPPPPPSPPPTDEEEEEGA
ncbi:MAG TPA: hypothetical protein VGW58_12950 [Pyrinomonadaceae bacterium]|nr:hypothetical protein [Pyrinomonadaceae bacterium]